MECDEWRDLRVSQLSFIGKILAGFTHEIKNHLSFIKESAGLIGDIIESKKSLAGQDLQQTVNILQSIENQIGKTAALCNCLNRFAHKMDHQMSSFSVNENLEDLIALLSRFAQQKKINLERNFQKDLPSIHNNPSLVQFLTFCFFEEMMRRLDKDSRITVETAALEDSIRIRIMPEGNAARKVEEKSPCSSELLQEVIKQLGAKLLQEDKEMMITIPLTLEPGLPGKI